MIRFRAQGHIVITFSSKAKCVIDETAMLFNILQKKCTLKIRLLVVGKCFFTFSAVMSVSLVPLRSRDPPPSPMFLSIRLIIMFTQMLVIAM